MRHRKAHTHAIEQELVEHGFQVHDVEGLEARHVAILNEPESRSSHAGIAAMADRLLAGHPAIALALPSTNGPLG
jgi:hypothetical protein